MRVVIDTNVFIGACIGKGAASEIISAAIQGKIYPLMGAALFLEYEDVLGREEIFRKARLNAMDRELLFNVFISKCEWRSIYFKWRPNLRDEADNHLIELAIAGRADYIVTNNLRDFRDGELRLDGLTIATPDAFRKELET